jgi:nitrogen fixation protein FixH
MMTSKSGTFTGKHMAAVFACGFGIVIAVNLFMAWNAVGGFHGTVVDNSYVASQKYNGWIAKAEASKALGWQVMPERRADGRVVLETIGLPEGATIEVQAERPLGNRETLALTFAPQGQGSWLSNEALAAGRWQLRMAIRAPGAEWAGKAELR